MVDGRARGRQRFAPARIFGGVISLVFGGPADLLAVRFATSPAWETLNAVRTFVPARAGGYHATWRAAVADELPSLSLGRLLAVNPPRGSVPDFLTPPPLAPSPRIDDQLAEIRATPPGEVAVELERCRATTVDATSLAVLDELLADPAAARDALADDVEQAWLRLIAPFWPRISALVEADVAHRSRLLAARGLRAALDGLDPRIRWHEGSVTVDAGDALVPLDGRGLVLMPSAYVWPAVAVVTDEPWQPTIVYPARGVGGLWESPAPPAALDRLLGRTRALLLSALDAPASTTALAARHELSPSGVSRHVIVLRDGGLVVGRRHRHEVRYERTALGDGLLRGYSPSQ
jgi:DNA-binding transcriptional ArsR family regulator